MQQGEVKKSLANIKKFTEKLDYRISVSINKGIPKFIDWYKSYN